uniref:Multidrug/pheromone exporter, MDR family, ABC transporter family n=1 Tax=Arundo donax TaxID=35708 RepID=A0A0A8Z234_ARUDO
MHAQLHRSFTWCKNYESCWF